jgi:class 3 adenylate cyclase
VGKLDAATRAKLPDRAFAYIDSQGRRRLPIHDASHVRNALARFRSVDFEDDAARERARVRLLRAAQKHRIVPVGFIAGELEVERRRAPGDAGPLVVMPTGFVTMLLTDIEASTALVQRLGDGYGAVLDDVRSILRDGSLEHGGFVVEARADDSFAAFDSPAGAVQAALAIQRALAARSWADDVRVAVRIGIHSGYPTPTADNYIGMAVHTAARVAGAGHGGQIVVSGDARTALAELALPGVRFRRLGVYRLRGIPEETALYQVLAEGLGTRFPPPRV